MTRADYEIDHCVAEGLHASNDNARTLSADDGKLLRLRCHEKKTKRDVFEIAKMKRLQGEAPRRRRRARPSSPAGYGITTQELR